MERCRRDVKSPSAVGMHLTDRLREGRQGLQMTEVRIAYLPQVPYVQAGQPAEHLHGCAGATKSTRGQGRGQDGRERRH